MRIGANWIAPQALASLRELYLHGQISFCEIMLDNFAHIAPENILQALGDMPVCLHITSSRFLERSSQSLHELAAYLKDWIKILKPFYVSDHLLDFSGAMIAELDYEKKYQSIKQRVNEWQSLLDTQILFENHASISLRGTQQAEFFSTLMRDTQAGLLFDFSNAYIAEYNNVAAFASWEKLIKHTKHFHVGGFRIDDATGLALDTHDRLISAAVLALTKTHLADKPDATLVIECNAAVAAENWQQEIARIQQSECANIGQVALVQPSDLDTQKQLANKNLQHKIFHYAPMLKKRAGDSLLFADFISHCEIKKLPLDWRLHFHLLLWLQQHPDWVQHCDDLLVRELLIASATRWSLQGLDHVAAQGVLLHSQHAPEVAVGLWKSREAGRAGKIVLVNAANFILPCIDSYGISHHFGSWREVVWQPILEA